MIRELYREPKSYLGKEVRVGGWIRTIRDQKNFAFINLNDGSFFQNLQIVVTREDLDNYDEIAHFGNGAAIIVEGEVVETPQAKQAFELKAKKVLLEGDSPAEYPLQPKRHSPEFLRKIAHLRPRTNLYSAIFRVRSEAAFAIHEFFHQEGFVYVHTPIITSSDAEGAGEMFTVTNMDMNQPQRDNEGKVDYAKDFFGRHTHLTVSGQLSGECYAQAFRKIYTFGPTFRAENSNTPRHAAEFWMIEPEIAFADLNDNMDNAEAMLKHVISRVMERCPEEIDFFNQFVDKGLKAKLEHVLANDFARVTYTEAIQELENCKEEFQYPVFWGCDLQTEHERYIAEKWQKRPTFVTDYPKEIKAFYMKQNEDGKTVAAMDCLVPGIGELIGGSQREDSPEKLRKHMQNLGLNEEEYWWYLELRDYGSTRHSGYGLGFERLIMYLTGASNIRDVIPFPRTVGSAEF